MTLLAACKLARAYLGKAIADGLLSNCSMSPERALEMIDEAIREEEGKEKP